jgi:hypothetical protein
MVGTIPVNKGEMNRMLPATYAIDTKQSEGLPQ